MVLITMFHLESKTNFPFAHPLNRTTKQSLMIVKSLSVLLSHIHINCLVNCSLMIEWSCFNFECTITLKMGHGTIKINGFKLPRLFFVKLYEISKLSLKYNVNKAAIFVLFPLLHRCMLKVKKKGSSTTLRKNFKKLFFWWCVFLLVCIIFHMIFSENFSDGIGSS